MTVSTPGDLTRALRHRLCKHSQGQVCGDDFGANEFLSALELVKSVYSYLTRSLISPLIPPPSRHGYLLSDCSFTYACYVIRPVIIR
jgi:hypothetical protein